MADLISFWLRMLWPADPKTISVARIHRWIKVAAVIPGCAPSRSQPARARQRWVAAGRSASEETRVRGLRSQAHLCFLMLREASRPVHSPPPAAVLGLV